MTLNKGQSNKRDMRVPWPRKGDKLFRAPDDAGYDWWFNACLNFMPTSVQRYGHARGYRLAADILVQHIGEAKRDQDVLVYPIVFLYRHYVELMLKSLIRDVRVLLRRPAKARRHNVPLHHRLTSLWQECAPLLAEAFPDEPQQDFDAVSDYVRQFSEVDPISTSFRYPEDKSGAPSVPGLKHINLASLRGMVDRLDSFLDGASSAIDHALDASLESGSPPDAPSCAPCPRSAVIA
jgi:hypothetical protein